MLIKMTKKGQSDNNLGDLLSRFQFPGQVVVEIDLDSSIQKCPDILPRNHTQIAVAREVNGPGGSAASDVMAISMEFLLVINFSR